MELEHPYLSILTGDFNSRCSSWWTEDIDNQCGIEIESLTSFFGMHQLIDSPTHILQNSSSCIDLIFCSQPNLVMSSGTHPSLFPTCHHQIIYANLDFKVNFPPPYQRKVWNYKKADSISIRRSLSLLDWERMFQNLDIDAQVDLLNETLLNIFENFIPNKIITCKNKEPPWASKKTKTAYHRMSRAFHNYNRRGRRDNDRRIVEETKKDYKDIVSSSKEAYFHKLGKKLNDSSLIPKTYWSILNNFLGKRKIPQIPPIIFNGTFVTDFKEKAMLVNDFFVNQCVYDE